MRRTQRACLQRRRRALRLFGYFRGKLIEMSAFAGPLQIALCRMSTVRGPVWTSASFDLSHQASRSSCSAINVCADRCAMSTELRWDASRITYVKWYRPGILLWALTLATLISIRSCTCSPLHSVAHISGAVRQQQSECLNTWVSLSLQRWIISKAEPHHRLAECCMLGVRVPLLQAICSLAGAPNQADSQLNQSCDGHDVCS